MNLSGSLTFLARFCDFQVSKFLQHCRYHTDMDDQNNFLGNKNGAERVNDITLELLQSTPMISFTKVQRINISNRILQQLLNKAFSIAMVASALHLLTNLVQMPSSAMMILKQYSFFIDSGDEGPLSSFLDIARWLDDLAAEGNVPYDLMMEFNRLTAAVVE